jgi:hypothetical protein
VRKVKALSAPRQSGPDPLASAHLVQVSQCRSQNHHPAARTAVSGGISRFQVGPLLFVQKAALSKSDEVIAKIRQFFSDFFWIRSPLETVG